MGNFQRPLDYVDVASRLAEMREKFPDLTMQQIDMKFLQVGGKDWVVYTAAAYRTPDDQRPGIGTAWEPIPGPTPYTKDSEVQNAETAAWGRALIAIGASTKNGIASAEEVTNRSGGEPQNRDSGAGRSSEPIEIDDPRLIAILGAEFTGNDFINDLCVKFRQYGKLSEKQLDSGCKAATQPGRPRVAVNNEPPNSNYQFDEAPF